MNSGNFFVVVVEFSFISEQGLLNYAVVIVQHILIVLVLLKLPLVCAYLQPLILAPKHVEKGPSHNLFQILRSDQSFSVPDFELASKASILLQLKQVLQSILFVF